jgi:putative transposase
VEFEVGVPRLQTCRVVGVGVPPRTPTAGGRRVARFSLRSTSALAIPDRVSVAMTEIAESMQDGACWLWPWVSGLQVMQALTEADLTELASLKGRHDEARTAVRHGRERGSVTLGGSRLPVTRPRGAGRGRGGWTADRVV